MLSTIFKTEEGQAEAETLIENFRKDGNPDITFDTFLDENHTYMAYTFDGVRHEGYFSKEDLANFDKIADYFNFKIQTVAG